MRHQTFAIAFAFLWLPISAAAQAWPGRVLVGVSGAMQVTSSTFDDDFTFMHPYSGNIPGEEARVDSQYEIPTGALFDGGVAVRLVGNLGVGVSLSQSSSTEDFTIVAQLPHPFYLARFREVEGTVAGRHSQRGIHVQGVYVVPLTPRLYLALSGGPSQFTVEQRLVRSVTASESFPFDQATFASADLETADESGWGFNAGADVGWMLSKHFGIGGLVRYSAVTVTLTPSGREAVELEAGGLHVGVGARIAF